MVQTKAWPELPLDKWQDTYHTLHMWTQIVGKTCLALTPRVNHFWNVAMQVTSSGLSTQLMTYKDRRITMSFDLIDHKLRIVCADGDTREIALEPKSVASFYAEFMRTLDQMGIHVRLWKMPVEVADPIPFDKDETHHSYDPVMASAFHQALLSMKPVMEEFRCQFIGKCSPVHFFWGGFDLAVTRFSGKRAPSHPELGSVYVESYSHEVVSHGFWPGGKWPMGGAKINEPVFYAYAVPEPDGFSTATIAPTSAHYDNGFHEYFLTYDAVRSAASPERELTRFMESTYDIAATLGKWDRANLERS